ncbi:polysaccharide deacetylase family protein [Thalassotalea montiporae]
MIHSLLQLLGKVFTRNKLTILIYHQVLPERDPLRPTEPDEKKFSWQMALLERYFNPISLNDAITQLENKTLPANSVCVTFDDGYLNNLTKALPILKKFNIPATVYVATAFSDGENMWNDRVIEIFAQHEHGELNLSSIDLGLAEIKTIQQKKQWIGKTLKALKYLPIEERLNKVSQLYKNNPTANEKALMMTPQQVKELSDAGITIGSHTHNHPILKGMNEEDCLKEVALNKSLLEQWTGKTIDLFAYPNGRPNQDYDEATISVIKKQGFRCAVSTQWGIATPSADLWQLKRFTPWDEQPWKFHARMFLNTILKSKH